MRLDFGEAVRRFYRNYTNPHGRSQRSAFWWVMLFQVIIYGVLFAVMFMASGSQELLDALIEADPSVDAAFAAYGVSGKFALFLAIMFGLLNILPNIMLEIRRFHDLGQTGWWVLAFRVASILPVIGNVSGIANLVWFAFPGTAGSNKYGPDPLQPNSDIFG